MRPIYIDRAFSLAIDSYTCLWGGLLLPRLCLKELNERIGETDLLLSLESSCAEDTHLSKSNYFNICMSSERSFEVAKIASCMIAVFAYESLKAHSGFEIIKENNTIRFLRHLRNAAAHGNRFWFINSRSNKFVDPGTVSWRRKTINKELQDQVAFPNFFPHGDFGYLFEDITKLLK
jgi:hypothetical protein